MKQFVRILSALLVFLLLAGCSDDAVQEKPQKRPTKVPSEQSTIPSEEVSATDPVVGEKKYPIIGARGFSDGYAWVRITIDGQDYHAVIDTNGRIKSKYSIVRNEPYAFSGGISCMVTSPPLGERGEKIYTLLTPEGVIASSEDGSFDEVVAHGDGMALVYKKGGGIEAVQHLYGVMDSKGNWLWPLSDWKASEPKKVDAYYGDSGKYLGEGMFALLGGVIFNANDGTLIYIKNSSFKSWKELPHNSFENGISLFCGNDDWYVSTSPDNLDDPSSKQSPAIVLHTDGTVEKIDAYDADSRVFGSLVVRRVDRHLAIVDYSSEFTGIFDAFSQEYITDMIYSDGYILLDITGADRERYVTLLDRQGVQQFEPIKVSSHRGNFRFAEGKIIFPDSDNSYAIVDSQGNYLAQNLQHTIWDNFDSGLLLTSQGGVIIDAATSLAYIDASGNEVITEVTEY